MRKKSLIFKLIFSKLVFGIHNMAFKNSLHSVKLYLVVLFEFVQYFLKCGKTMIVTPRTPVLKKEKVVNFSLLIA